MFQNQVLLLLQGKICFYSRGKGVEHVNHSSQVHRNFSSLYTAVCENGIASLEQRMCKISCVTVGIQH